MINRELVGPDRRIEITLTSKKAVEDPIKKLGRIVDSVARIWKNDDVFAIWVRALQERGEWHFHLALYHGGEPDLSDADREAIGDYAIERWQDYAKQEEPVQGAVRLPQSAEDLDILDAYDSGQETKQKKTKDAKADDDNDETVITKKTKLFGVLRRAAYWRHVEITKFVVEDLSDLFTFRRLHRRALQARMRSWRRPCRHRPHRFAVEGRFHLPEKVSLQLHEYVRKQRYGATPPPPETLP
ncbi:MAG: hypothetical protein HC888_10315 [Candidatus Competibacteraceae bacterium]|nr:hypothetical protein [Candidatus Competibacteraceae bacterium]